MDCGTNQDIPLLAIAVDQEVLRGFFILDLGSNLKGYCPHCSEDIDI